MKEKMEEEVLFPQTKEALDAFVAEVIKQGNLPDNEHTYEAIATKILHTNQERDSAPYSYFIRSVRKQIANKIAYDACIAFAEARKAEEEAQKAKLELVPQESSTVEPAPLQNA